MYKKILLPTDGSKLSDKAEERAIFIAKKSGAEIIALSVVETNYSVGLPSDDTIFYINEMLKKESDKNLKKFEKVLNESGMDIKLSLKIEEGSPADVILETINNEGIDLVVMGSSGKSGLDKFIMGSVTEKVLKTAKCDTLVVH
ncbi:MAG: universal stress protein [Methanobacteriaceae archaeon]